MLRELLLTRSNVKQVERSSLFKLNSLAQPLESLVNFVVFDNRSFNLPLSVSLFRGISGLRINGITIL